MLNSIKNLNLKRKIQIGSGILLLVISAITNSPFWAFGLFLILIGSFNLCPTCQNGSCEIDSSKKAEEKNLQ
jgi:hypothetical protein